MTAESRSVLFPETLCRPEIMVDPHPTLHRLRAEDPVHWSSEFNGWVLTRYDDIVETLRDERMSPDSMTDQFDMLPAAVQEELIPLRKSLSLWIGRSTEEDHLRLQKLLKRYFTPRAMDALRPHVQTITDDVLDAVQGRGEMDVVRDIAYTLPIRVMGEMLGLPDRDHARLDELSKDVGGVVMLDVNSMRRSQSAVLEMSESIRRVVVERRRNPKNDMISDMLRAQTEGLIRSEDEIVANCVLLVYSGHGTTASVINAGLLALLQHPEALAKLRADESLFPSALEEILRFDGPTHFVHRTATAALEIRGRKIEPQQVLVFVLPAANRDPEHFPDPDRFDITRQDNRHLAFGSGAFYCVAAAMARMEADVCFRTVLRRMPALRPQFDAAPWEAVPPLGRTLRTLPVSF